MNHLPTNNHTLIWLWFTFYAMSIVLLLPNYAKGSKIELIPSAVTDKQALSFAYRMLWRSLLVIPMIFLLRNFA